MRDNFVSIISFLHFAVVAKVIQDLFELSESVNI